MGTLIFGGSPTAGPPRAEVLGLRHLVFMGFKGEELTCLPRGISGCRSAWLGRSWRLGLLPKAQCPHSRARETNYSRQLLIQAKLGLQSGTSSRLGLHLLMNCARCPAHCSQGTMQHNTGTLNPTELSASLRPYPRGSIQLASQLGTEHRLQIIISGDSTIRRHSSHPITDRNTESLFLKTGIISKAGSLSTAGM